MSVVLRCSTCGTTQGHAGECEACSEGEVRYFCTNHGVGIWLEGPVCNRCGATFGVRSEEPPRATASRRALDAPDFRPGTSREPSRRREPEIGSGRPEREEPDDAEVVPPAPSLAELLTEMAEERARARARHDAEDVPWTERRTDRPAFPVIFPIGGCLVRIVGVVFLVIAALVLLLFVLFGGLVMY